MTRVSGLNKSMKQKTKDKIAAIQRRYNAENDTPPGPDVTWSDYMLLDIIQDLCHQIENLEDRIEDIESRQLNSLDNYGKSDTL